MSTYTGKNGRVRLGAVAFDADGHPTTDGPSGGHDVGQVVAWRLRHTESLDDATTFGDDFRTAEAGLKAWDADLELLWDAENGGQTELWDCLLDASFSGSLGSDGRVELTLYVDGTTPEGKRAYYGAAVAQDARVLTAREGLVRLNARFAGVGALRYRSGLFGDGTFGAMEGYAFASLAGTTFQNLQTLSEV